MICPNCQHENDSGARFCDDCGERLPEGGAESSGASSRVSQDSRSCDSVQADSPQTIESSWEAIIENSQNETRHASSWRQALASEDFSSASSPSSSSRREPPLEEASMSREGSGACSGSSFGEGERASSESSSSGKAPGEFVVDIPFRVYFANNRFLLVDHEFFLDYKIEVLDSTIRRVEVWWCDKDVETPRLVRREELSGRFGQWPRTFEFGVCYVAHLAGFLRPKAYVVCHSDNMVRFFQVEGTLVHQAEVYRVDKPPQEILAQYNQNINVSGEGNSTGNTDGSEIKINIGMPKDAHDAHSLISKLAATPANYIHLDRGHVSEIIPSDDAVYAKDALQHWQHDKLTLKLGEHTLHIISEDVVSFGRHGALNDFAIGEVYSGGEDGVCNPNRTVSRQHMRIEKRGVTVSLHDMSSHGTYYSGMKLSERSSSRCTSISGDGIVRVGDYEFDMSLRVCDQKTCAMCGSCGSPGSGQLTSLYMGYKTRPEHYVVLWHCFCLSQLEPELEGCVLSRRNGVYVLEQSDGTVQFLVPGSTMQLGKGNQELVVEMFNQSYGQKAVRSSNDMKGEQQDKYGRRAAPGVNDRYYGRR